MVKVLFFDAGPIITLVMSRLSWILPPLKKQFGGKFYLTPSVKYELVDRPLKIKRFEFEAIQVMKMIREGTFEVYDNIPQQKINQLENLANNAFKIKKKSMDVVQSGELESVASALQAGAAGVVIDERTLRLFIESGKEMESLLEHRFHKNVVANHQKIREFSEQLKGIKIIRSIELVAVAYRMGLLKDYIPPLKGGEGLLLDALLWATKTNGCAVTEQGISEIKQMLLK